MAENKLKTKRKTEEKSRKQRNNVISSIIPPHLFSTLPKPSANNVLPTIRPQQHSAGTQRAEICQRIVNRQFFLNKKYCVLIGRAHVFPDMHGISLVERVTPTQSTYT